MQLFEYLAADYEKRSIMDAETPSVETLIATVLADIQRQGYSSIQPKRGSSNVPPFQPFLIEKESVAVPAEKLHHLPVLAEEDKHITAKQRLVQFIAHNLGQSVDAKVHPHIVLAHIVPAAIL